MVGARVDDTPGSRVRLEEAVGPVVVLDPREIPLQHRRVEDLVVDEDAPKQAEKPRGLGRRELAFQVALVDPTRTDDSHGVDSGPSRRKRSAPSQGGE